MNIYSNNVVNDELKRLELLKGTDGDRDVDFDISILKDALIQIEKLINGNDDHVIIEVNMWEECHKSLFRIFEELNLTINDDKSEFDYYQFAIERC